VTNVNKTSNLVDIAIKSQKKIKNSQAFVEKVTYITHIYLIQNSPSVDMGSQKNGKMDDSELFRAK